MLWIKIHVTVPYSVCVCKREAKINAIEKKIWGYIEGKDSMMEIMIQAKWVWGQALPLINWMDLGKLNSSEISVAHLKSRLSRVFAAVNSMIIHGYVNYGRLKKWNFSAHSFIPFDPIISFCSLLIELVTSSKVMWSFTSFFFLFPIHRCKC